MEDRRSTSPATPIGVGLQNREMVLKETKYYRAWTLRYAYSQRLLSIIKPPKPVGPRQSALPGGASRNRSLASRTLAKRPSQPNPRGHGPSNLDRGEKSPKRYGRSG
jgi:hypothetical protein